MQQVNPKQQSGLEGISNDQRTAILFHLSCDRATAKWQSLPYSLRNKTLIWETFIFEMSDESISFLAVGGTNDIESYFGSVDF